MDLVILKKRLSSFRTAGGSLTKVNGDLLVDILRAWEVWAGSSREFYKGLGLTRHQLSSFIREGKKVAKKGNYGTGEFKELKLDSLVGAPSAPIEVSWGKGKVIRFNEVDVLVDFLKKVA